MHSLLQARQILTLLLRQPAAAVRTETIWPSNTRSNLSLIKLVLATMMLALFTSCASNKSSRQVAVDDIVIGDGLEPDGELGQFEDTPALVASDAEDDENARQASQAEYYRQQAAEQSDVVERVNNTLSSAEYYVQANQHQKAAEMVLSIVQFISTKEQEDRSIIVLAYADYAYANYQQALWRLEPLLNESADGSTSDEQDKINEWVDNAEQNRKQADDRRDYIDANKAIQPKRPLSTQQVDALLLSSLCYQALNDHENAIAALIRRESALYGAARAETTRYLWQVINAVPAVQREFIMENSRNPQVQNRIRQSLNGTIGDVNRAPQQFNQWREDYTPNKPSRVVDSQWGPNSPRSIYVLLPLSSRFGKAAQAVKAGLEREHRLNESLYRPNLSFYDIGDNPLQIGQYYAAAVRAGADFIIGPIGKTFSNEANDSAGYFSGGYAANDYDRRYNGTNSNVPMLMLGGDQQLTTGNLRLSMSPELEGQQVADRAWQDGHLSAGVMLPNTDRGQRVLNGFSQRWLALGGKLSQVVRYSSQQFDHSAELKQLFSINASEYRSRRLNQVLGEKLKFSPYQRGDIDFVLMVANNKTGRIVRPQINFFTNSQLPVYATASVYNGIEDSIANMDLDATRFPVMPWVVRSSKVTQYAGQLNMLQAMGMDAYRVAGSLATLRSSLDTALQGNSGQLQLHSGGEIHYQPAWAKFTNGELQMIDSMGMDLAPLELNSDDAEVPGIDNQGNNNQRSRGSYNDQNWDSRGSRRKTGG